MNQATYQKTLEELEDDEWGDPPFQSYVVTECHRLRKIPINQLSTENLRLLIGQNISLDTLLPVTLEKLSLSPWIAGDFFEGDLLQSVLAVAEQYWRIHLDARQTMLKIVDQAINQANECKADEENCYEPEIVQSMNIWKQKYAL